MRDFIVPKNWTLRQVKEMLAEKYVPLKPEQMLIVEEETQRQVNLMSDDNMLLSKYGYELIE